MLLGARQRRKGLDVEAIGWVAAVFELAGVYVIGNRSRIGFVLSAVGNVLWIVFVLLSSQSWGLLLVCPVALVLNFRGWRRWRIDRKTRG